MGGLLEWRLAPWMMNSIQQRPSEGPAFLHRPIDFVILISWNMSSRIAFFLSVFIEAFYHFLKLAEFLSCKFSAYYQISSQDSLSIWCISRRWNFVFPEILWLQVTWNWSKLWSPVCLPQNLLENSPNTYLRSPLKFRNSGCFQSTNSFLSLDWSQSLL